MILEEETFEKFGYYPSDLAPQSNKRVLIKCDKCGLIRESSKHGYKALCKSCSGKGRKDSEETRRKKRIAIHGKNHPFYGKHHTEETRMKISNNLKGRYVGKDNPHYGKSLSEEHKKKLSEAHKGKKLSEEHKCNLGRKGKKHWIYGKHHTEETKQKIRDTIGESRVREKNANWQGGISYLPYCSKFNKKFKEGIRNKFERRCFLCGALENGRKHCVHHVNYDKNCLCDDNISCQFVPLCASCHAKTNSNREYYQTLIMNKLAERIDGWYI